MTQAGPIGILMLDMPLDGMPRGDMTFHVPVLCRQVKGCTVERLVFEGERDVENAMVAEARSLVAEGARALIGSCGFMIRHQAAVSNAVDVPVALSSLLLAPLLLACMGSHRKVGIVTASARSLTDEALLQAGVADRSRVVVADLEDQPAFQAGLLYFTSKLDVAAVERELLDVTSALVEENPDISAVLLECTALPRYSATLQRTIGVPVFDSVRLIDLFVRGLVPPPVGRFALEGTGGIYLPRN